MIFTLEYMGGLFADSLPPHPLPPFNIFQYFPSGCKKSLTISYLEGNSRKTVQFWDLTRNRGLGVSAFNVFVFDLINFPHWFLDLWEQVSDQIGSAQEIEAKRWLSVFFPFHAFNFCWFSSTVSFWSHLPTQTLRWGCSCILSL